MQKRLFEGFPFSGFVLQKNDPGVEGDGRSPRLCDGQVQEPSASVGIAWRPFADATDSLPGKTTVGSDWQ